MPRGGPRAGAGRPKGRKSGEGRGRQKRSPPPGDGPAQSSKAIPVKGEIVTTTPFLVPADAQPREFLLSIMRDPELPLGFRRQAAVDALPYCHPKVGELGKKAAADLEALDRDQSGTWGDLLN
jgi:phage terminase small subunit